MSSANELNYQIILSKDLAFIDNETSNKLLVHGEEIKKMLNALIHKLSK
ncbi:four helix bundle protein [Flavobacterium sp. N1719]